MNKKGFTLIEIVIATAVLSLTGIAVSFGVGSVYHYYVLSNQTKAESDAMYDAAQSENTPASELDAVTAEASLTYDGGEIDGLQVNTYHVKNSKPKLKENVEDISLVSFADASAIQNQTEVVPAGYSYTVKDRLEKIDETQTSVGDTSSNNKGDFDASHGYSNPSSDPSCAHRYKVGDYVTYNGKHYYKVQDRFWYTNDINVNDRIYPVTFTNGQYSHYGNGYRISDLIDGYGTRTLPVGSTYYLDPYGGQQKSDQTQDLGITAFISANNKATFVLSPGTCFYMDRAQGYDIYMFSGWQNVETSAYDEFSSYEKDDLVMVGNAYKKITALSNPYVGSAQRGNFTVHNQYTDVVLTDDVKQAWRRKIGLSEEAAS